MVRKEIDKLKKTESPGPDDIFPRVAGPFERTLIRANTLPSERFFERIPFSV